MPESDFQNSNGQKRVKKDNFDSKIALNLLTAETPSNPEAPKVYKKIVAKIASDSQTFNLNLNTLRDQNRSYFSKKEAENNQQRKAISQLQHTSFLSSTFSTPPVTYLNQLNTISSLTSSYAQINEPERRLKKEHEKMEVKKELELYRRNLLDS